MLEPFLKVPPLKKILEVQNQKEAMKFEQKENFEPKIKPMIENLQYKLYQLENKQAKSAKLRANIRSWTAKNAQKLSSKYLKDRI